ncbi:regucalcin-like isoform X1 [Musca domestica]|uniref:Regucalcin-like isoform X1 n=2 Tax=Musca domestica TaxID=7370 RepID=A0ABM3UMX7_MUSDO|nr:regucalcin-like isoform X1 [Musca domestica]
MLRLPSGKPILVLYFVCCLWFARQIVAENNVDEPLVEKVVVSLEVHVNSENFSMSYKVEPLPESHAELGEGPHWDVERQSLYYVDIHVGKIYRYDYNEDKVYKAQIENETLAGFIIPIEGTTNEFAVGAGRRVIVVTWDGVSPVAKVKKTLFEVQQGDQRFNDNRFNDGKCDPQGRLFAGTMKYVGDEFEHRYGELYKYEKGGKVEVVKSDVGISNGLAWNEKTKKFYYIDTTDYEVKEYDYDFATGKATNPKVVFNLRKNSPKDHLLPDGMTIDTDGNIYVATFNGHTIFKVDPKTGNVLLEIKFPCKQITSAAFGGPNLDILYVTTSSRFGEPDPAGTTYKVTGLGAKGLPMTKMQV